MPAVLLCFTIACLAFIHIDNMNKLEKEANLAEEFKVTDQ